MKIQPEQANTEYKTASKGRIPKDLWKTIVAFANTDGGKIYFGVEDDASAKGFSNKEVDRLQKEIASLCNSGDLSVKLYPEISVVENNVVLTVIEPVQATRRPVYRLKNGVENGTYIRVGSTNQKADLDIIHRFMAAANGGAECNEYDESCADVLDLPEIEAYISTLNHRNDNIYQRFSQDDILTKLRIIDKSHSKVTLFGLLAFSKERALQEIVSPTMNIAVTKFSGINKVDESNLKLPYESDKEFNGSIANQFSSALSYIKSLIPTKSIIDDSGMRIDKLAIPEVAIREALANALAHRDYSTSSARIQVDIYQNRIEITNPGISLVPIERIDTDPSMTRNPLLMNYLKEIGIVEQKGRGIRTIICALKDDDLVAPKFENLAGKSFRATLYNTAIMTDEDKKFLAAIPNVAQLNKRQANAIIYAKYNDNGINNGEYREINDMRAVRDDKKANIELNKLVECGVFEAVGKGKGRRYLLTLR